MRTCPHCPAKFHDLPANKEREARSALQQFSDHLLQHQPEPKQWSEAYTRIQAGKERAKPTP